MMLPKATIETWGRSEPTSLGRITRIRTVPKVWGTGSFRSIRQTGWKELGVRVLKNKAEDITGR